MKSHEVRTYTVSYTNDKIGNQNKLEEETRYQKIDSVKSKLLAFQTNKKKNRYSSNSVHEVNSASSADEWVDLDEEEIDSENENNGTTTLSTAVVKSTANPHHLARTQNFIR